MIIEVFLGKCVLVLDYKYSSVCLEKVTTAMFISEQRMKHFSNKGSVFTVMVF